MTEDRSYLLLDQGGHSSRALVMDSDGRVRAQASSAVVTAESGDGRVEQDGEAILTGLRAVIAEAAGQLGSQHRTLHSAALAVQRGSVLCWDRSSGEALTPVLSWRDRRQPKIGPGEEAAEQVRKQTGLRLSPYGGAAKLRWCFENEANVRSALDEGRLAFGPLASFLLRSLLEEHPHVIDHSIAQRTLLFSRHQLDWSEELLELFHLPRGPLPHAVPSEYHYGHLHCLPERPPLKLVLGDQNAVPSLFGNAGSDTAFINMGTGAFLLRPVQGAITAAMEASPFQISLLPGGGVDGRAAYALEGSIHGAGSALDWLAWQEAHELPFEHFDAVLEAITEPPLFLNTIDGLGSPWWQSGPEPRFLSNAIGDFQPRLAGVLESVVFLARANIDMLSQLGDPVERVVIAGGLSASDAFCQRLADCLGCELHRLQGGEATITGLWRCLSGAPADGPGVDGFAARSNPALDERYRRWRAAMPEVEG